MQTIYIALIDSDKHSIETLKDALRILFEERFDLAEETYVEFLTPESYTEALTICKAKPIDLVLCENSLVTEPGYSGLQFAKDLRREYSLRHVPCIILTGETDLSLVEEAIEDGLSEFFLKPISNLNLLKIRNIVDHAIQYRKMRKKMLDLSSGMDGAIDIVKEQEREIIFRLAKAAEMRDQETGNHIYRVGQYSVELAKTLGLSFSEQETLEKAAPLHDVGKIAIPDSILRKPGKLTDEEYRIMKNHTIYGYKILYNPNMALLKMAADVALGHHERWDGKGYPFGKKGEEISLAARIVSVADIFDAFTSRRRYKEAWTLEKAYQEIQNEKGAALDAQVVDAMMESKAQFEHIRETLKDEQ